MHVRHFSRKVLLIAAAVILALPLALEAAKPIPVTVTLASPSEAIQGERKTIKITGTGFDNGSQASFLVSGTTDASQIVVAATSFKSSTELEADIQVQPSALTVNYDVEVRTSTGRKGKGTTLFKVNLDPSVILPLSLGVPTGCNNSSGTGLNDGAYPAALIVAADTYSCTAGKDRPYRWQNGAWYNLGTLGSATTGYASGVSDDGKVVGWVTSSAGINSAFVVSGSTMSALPLLGGMVQSFAEGISEGGQHVFGYNTLASQGTGSAVRWSRGLGGAWNAELIGDVAKQQPGVYWLATGSSDEGSVLVGYGRYPGDYVDPALRNVQESWLWMEGGAPQWVSLGLRAVAYDVDPSAIMIVGTRYQDNGDTTFTPVAVYWTVDDGFSVRHDLIGMGGEGSVAKGVGKLHNGALVIVGEADTLGGQSQARKAVAWLPQSPGVYGAPTHLAAINGSSSQFAGAVDVNANGVVVGYSDTGGVRRAVLWMLPTP